ncbi:hypothetical protein MJO29_002800 [Puccinia striiformis f. sp. tritici]|nr:hypothetical protein MJO29_002800 [Puccinia striiformis f. sp. tritici]
MNQQWSRRPFSQTENGYETRIRYLEEIVHLLLVKTNSPPPLIVSSAPRVGSFRYSADRGLVPLLSEKTARSLAVARWDQQARSSLNRTSSSTTSSSNSGLPFTRSLERNRRNRHCQPLSNRRLSDGSRSNSSPTMRSPSGVRTNSSAARLLSLDRLPPSRYHVSTNFNHAISRFTDHNVMTQSETAASCEPQHHPGQLVMSPSAQQPTSPGLKGDLVKLQDKEKGGVIIAKGPNFFSSSPTSSPPLTSSFEPNASIMSDSPFKPNASIMSDSPQPSTQTGHPSDIVLTDQADISTLSAAAEIHASPTITSSIVLCPEARALSPISSAGPIIDAVSVSEIAVTAQDPTLTSPLLNPPTLDATLDTLGSNKDIIEVSSQEAIRINHPTNIAAPTPSFSIDSSSDSAAIERYNNFEVAMVGGIEVIDVDASPNNPQLAPEYLRATREYYDDEGNGFKLNNIYETEKKKKKKKKTTTSGSNPSLTSPPAVGALSIISEEALASLERMNDPRCGVQTRVPHRYRPIEDSEFIGFDECNDSPTSTPNNPILFYV